MMMRGYITTALLQRFELSHRNRQPSHLSSAEIPCCSRTPVFLESVHPSSSENISFIEKLTQLDIDFVMKLAEPQRELRCAANTWRRLHQVRPHVLGALRAGVESSVFIVNY